MTMEPPLRAHSLNEIPYYLGISPCPRCGKGHWQADAPNLPRSGQGPIDVAANCSVCGLEKSFSFVCEYEVPASGPEAEQVNPFDAPSEIIDVSQWLGLFYLLIESASDDRSGPATRQKGLQAALCLAEALKFYGDDEMPPDNAFFCDTSAAMFREHPDLFARQKLRDMQSRLPALHKMSDHVARDERTAAKRWWQFWKK